MGENDNINKLTNGEQSDVDSPNPPAMEKLIPDFESFDDFLKAGFSGVGNGIKAANSLPKGENFQYYSCFQAFKNFRIKQTKKISELMQSIVERAGTAGSMTDRDTDEKFKLLIDTNDIFLDRTSVLLDEEAGIKKNLDVELIVTSTKTNNYGSWNTSTVNQSPKAAGTQNAQAIRLLAAKNVQRPQLSFKDKIDNSSKPWEPRIKDKPNSLKPLGIYLIDGINGQVFCHPYEFELDRFSPPEKQLKKEKPIKYKSLEQTPLIVIETLEDLQIMIKDLEKYDEIAVDLEHHSYRSFLGITCLMQISTRDTDYLVDTLSLRSELHLLNEIFTKPSVLKVFHGADLDIQWLQRDLSLYVVNMFDTHQAAKHLNLPYLSLAYLLKTHCKVDPNKHFQLADWRIRPLPEELMKYAREDTHYLLYIKDILQNALIDAANGQTNILKAVYDRGVDICKKIYEKPICDETSCMNMYRKSQKMFNNKQLYALKELFAWRDETARQEDDSTGYVLPNHMLLNIAETLPREIQGILACCNPIPPLVRQNLLKLHKLILKAREQPLINPVLQQELRPRLNLNNQPADSDIWMWSPHDNITGVDVQANLPCLINDEDQESSSMDTSDDKKNDKNLEKSRKVKHQVTVFDSSASSDDEDSAARKKLLKAKKLFVSPFQRYKLVIPMIAAIEELERKRKEEEEKRTEETKTRLAEREAADNAERVERIHEHFMNVVSQNDEISPVKPLNAYANSDLKRKAQKALNRKELEEKGMLPKQDFNYKEVDFSSFQGGSKTSSAKNAPFMQQQIVHLNKSQIGVTRVNMKFYFYQGILSISVNQTNIYNNTRTNNESTVIERKRFFSWPNGTKIKSPATVPRKLFKKGKVDCFGFGASIANGFDWLFQPGGSQAHELDIKFFLTSRNHPHRVLVLTGNQFGLEWTDFKIERKTIIIVHGFLSDGEMSWLQDMDQAFRLWWTGVLTATPGIIIKLLLLSHIVNATESASPESPKTNWGLIHMVGHSLGAHICGVAADEFKKFKSSWKITRITGLDPAQPCFSNSSLSLDVSDAPFVDIIHTNGQLMTKLGLGLPEPIGHVDFYPNGGKAQPGCLIHHGSALYFIHLPKHLINEAICSHGRSYVYFTESINAAILKDGKFWSHAWDGSYRSAVQLINESCDSNTCIEMGINSNNYLTRGSFFTVTSKSKPYYYVDDRDLSELMDQLRNDFSDEKYSRSTRTLANPPSVRLFLMYSNQITRCKAQFIIKISRVLINSTTLLKLIMFIISHIRNVNILIVIIFRLAAEFIKIAKVFFIRRIFR
ncbi:Similar to Exosc10: Exosome component 10 (Mus musculus), partial [Cotesia congregata]